MKFLTILLLFTVAITCFADTTVYRGTACGWGDPTDTTILCNGFNPRRGCPPGYSKQLFKSGVAYCYKTNTTIEKEGSIVGTLCGGLARALCDGLSTNEKCPPGYTQADRWICYKSDPTIQDVSGTVCGVSSDFVGQTCHGLPLRTCPDGYYPVDFEKELDWHACFKK